ncbi:hypothetical protein ACFW04_002727 [Cataglyphis niger]
MDTRTGESGGEPAATILDNNTGIATTTGPLAESSTSSSSSSSPSASSSSPTVAPTVILTESIATNAGNLSLTGSSQSLHQVHQQQQTRQRVNLIADVVANDVAGPLLSLMSRLPNPPSSPLSQLHSHIFPSRSLIFLVYHFSIFFNENIGKLKMFVQFMLKL